MRPDSTLGTRAITNPSEERLTGIFACPTRTGSSEPDDGQLHTLGLLEQLSSECNKLWGASSDAYFRVDRLLRELANPNLRDIPTNLTFRVELWDRHDQHIRWVAAASTSVAIGHAALDTAIATYPTERFMLRNGILVIRQHDPGKIKPGGL